jgi:ribonuclease PH
MPEAEVSLRKIHCRTGILSRSDGSVQLSQGLTTVVAGTFGPVEVKPHKELPGKGNIYLIRVVAFGVGEYVLCTYYSDAFICR